MDLGLEGRAVLVTGASQGLGRAIAEAFARERCRLHLVARGEAGLAAVKDELARRHGAAVETLALDMASLGASEKLAAAFPEIDILVNNAGGIVHGDVLAVGEAAWRAAWESKVFGYINLTRAYYARMQKKRSGAIVNVIGIGGERFDYEYSAGSTGNAALIAFTRTVGGASLDHGVRVVGINPGWVETGRTMRFLRQRAEALHGDAERWRDVIASWQLSRLIEPREVADLAVFLASPRASAITGTVVNVDLGLTARFYPPGSPHQGRA